jgi:Domain of unknown function (DUF5069)
MSMLARTIDKARAQLSGTLGEYVYDCPMDRQLFATLGIDADEFLEVVSRSPDDIAVVAWLRGRESIPEGGALDAHNDAIENWAPKSEEGRARFERQREALAPGRPDVTTWTDLLDIEEGRLTPVAG